MKKYAMTVLAALLCMMSLYALPLCAHAGTSVKALKEGKTYRYDVNNDGRKDKIRCLQVKSYMEDGQTQVNIYINGRRKIKAYGMKACNIYVFTQGKSSMLLSEYVFGDGGREFSAFTCKKNKYKASVVGPEGCFYTSARIKGGKLQLYGRPKFAGWMKSFSEVYEELPFYFAANYTLKNGKLKRAQAFYTIAGRGGLTAAGSFPTGKKFSSIAAGDGPYVSWGDSLKLTGMYYKDGCYYFRLKVNGKTCWIQDSSETPLRY